MTPWGNIPRDLLLFTVACTDHNFIYSVHVHDNKKLPSILTPSRTLDIPRPVPAPLVACSFATVVADAVSVAVQLAPQAKPVGQHPPPTVSAQLNQPLAQRIPLPLPPEFSVAVVTGTTIVTPFDVIVVEDVVGQDVVSQLRPVRQQPP